MSHHLVGASAGDLQSFAQIGLKPDERVMAEGKSFAQMIFKLLQQKSSYRLARVIIGGSVGKCTAITQIFDFDCVIFVNDQRPPFDKVLDDFENILLCCERSDIVCVRSTRHSVQFKCSATGFEYDLLPAANLVPEANLDDEKLVWLQRERALGVIRTDPLQAYTFSSSLVESQVQFMRKQSAFVHELVRLCKFWNKTLYLDTYISGRSTIIELIAVNAGNILETQSRGYSRGSGSLILLGFNTFLELVRDLAEMDIRFDAASSAATSTGSVMTRPILLEPANPFNNLLSRLDADTIRKLGTCAGVTLSRLSSSSSSSVEQLFKAQPSGYGSVSSVRPSTIHVTKGVEGVKHKSMVVQNKELDADNRKIGKLQDLVETYVLTNIVAWTRGSGLTSASGISDLLDTMRKEAEGTLTNLLWGSPGVDSDKASDTADIYFIIPFEIRGQPYWTRVGFWI